MNIVAEIGINHNGDIEIAKRLIDMAVLAGANYVKFQKRDPDICVSEEQKNKLRQTPWGELKYIDYKKKIEFDKKEYDEINKYCSEKGIGWFASVWDINSAKFMMQYTGIVKIPSAKITNTELIKYCRKHFNTLIISTGMSSECEIEKAIEDCQPDIIFHSNGSYPTEDYEVNLLYMNWLCDKYNNKKIGYSGHERGLIPSIGAAVLEIDWIERHVTLDKNMFGSDQSSSLEPDDFIKLCKAIRTIEKAKGKYCERVLWDSEKKKRLELQ